MSVKTVGRPSTAVVPFQKQGIFRRVWDALRGKSTAFHGTPLSAYLNFIGSQGLWQTANYETLARNGYTRNPNVFGSIRFVARGLGRLDWRLWLRTRDGMQEITEDTRGNRHPLLALLDRPNPLMGRSFFFQSLTSYQKIAGTAYVYSVTANPGSNQQPRELWPLRPDRVRVVPGDGVLSLISRYEWMNGSRKVNLDPAEVLALRTFHPLDDWRGLSEIEVAGRSIDQNNESRIWNLSLLQNRANPSGIAKTDQALTEEEANEMLERLRSQIQGSDNAGDILLFWNGFDFKPSSFNPVEMDWGKGIQQSAREIDTAHGVAPELLGDAANKTYSNFKEARKALWEENVLLTANDVRDEFNHFLTPRYGERLFLDYDRDGIPALQEERQQFFEMAQKSDFLSVNEKRELTGFEKVNGGDVILVGLNQVPLSGVGAPPTPSDEDEEETPAPRDEPEDDGGESEKLLATYALGLYRQGKGFNLKTEEQKGLWWKTFDRQLFQIASMVAAISRARLRMEKDHILGLISKAPTLDVAESRIAGFVLGAGNREAWENAYVQMYSFAALERARFVNRMLKFASFGMETKQTEEEDIWLTETRQYVASVSGEKIVGITDSTMKRVRRQVDAAIKEGESVLQLSKRIDRMYLDQIIPHRSEVIARTEALQAANFGSQAAAKTTGLRLNKEWISTRDGRTRGNDPEDRFDHFSSSDKGGPDGQVRRLEEAYNVSGEKLLFPGDTSLGASAGNTIQCRCTEGYLTT